MGATFVLSAVFIFTGIFLYLKFGRLARKEILLFFAALGVKIIAGLCLAYVYLHYFDGGDLRLYFTEAEKISNYLDDNDAGLLQYFLEEPVTERLHQSLVFNGQPRALFFVNIVAVFYEAAAGNFWIVSAYFSILAFLGCWIFYKTALRTLHLSSNYLVVSLFFWPSVVFWSSGLVKESVSLFLILSMISLVLWALKEKKYVLIAIILFGICAFLLFKIKYYYAAILSPILISYYIAELWKAKASGVRENVWQRVILFIGLFCTLLALGSQLHYNLKWENVLRVIVENYHLFVAKSEPGKLVAFEGLSPTVGSFLYHFPKALFSGLFRPNVWDIHNIWSLLAGVENLVLLILAFFQLKNLKAINKKYAVLIIAVFFYCIAMASLLCFSAPNLGTLVRYKVGFLPVFVLLVAYENPLLVWLNKKVRKMTPGLR